MADDELKHYGVKGMRWGVRNEDDPAGDGSRGQGTNNKPDDVLASVEEYKALTRVQPQLKGLAASKNAQQNLDKFHDKADNPGPPLGKEEKREAKASKFDDKAAPHQQRIDELNSQIQELEGSTRYRDRVRKNSLNRELAMETEMRDAYLKDAERSREGKLTSGQRKALVAAGVGALVVGSIAYSSHKQKMAIKDLEDRAANGDVDAKLQLFNHHVTQAKVKTWMFGGFIQDPTSWDREEFELPEGHTFHRISTKDESAHGFHPGTYCTPDEADFNRYVSGFRQEKGPNASFHHVTFQTKTPTKVPNLHTTIETLRETMGPGATKEQALAKYQSLSGGRWDTSEAGRFFTALQAKGYGAIVDEMDAGVIGNRPLVFFNYQQATPKQARPLDEGEISVREKSVELMTKPPRKA